MAAVLCALRGEGVSEGGEVDARDDGEGLLQHRMQGVQSVKDATQSHPTTARLTSASQAATAPKEKVSLSPS